MIAVDTNILVYCHRVDSPWHDRALAVITELAEGRADWAIPWPCLWEFLSIATHPGIYRPPTPMGDALTEIERWLESPTVQLLGDGDFQIERLRRELERSKVVGPGVHDARIATICISHGVSKLLTADRDFARFPRLRTENPLVD